MWLAARMASSKLRARLAKAGGGRRLTDTEATQILASQKTIHSKPEWNLTPNGDLRMDMPVLNSMNEPLQVGGRLSAKFAGKSTWWLMWGDKQHGDEQPHLRRLDIRGPHRQPDEHWDHRTHKHLWSVEHKNDYAYTPEDIPHEQPGTLVTVDNYREIFEAFVAECAIGTGPDYAWSEPIFVTRAGQQTIWEVQ